jgi:glycosyltransferase involved in cell wall biosynthesis
MTKITVIIPTFNREKILNNTLKHLVKAIADTDTEIIIVNDSKTPLTIITPLDKEVLILNNSGKGVASARNQGARHAKGKHLFFLDDDIVLLRGSINQLVRFSQEKYSFSCLNLNWILIPELMEKISHTYFGRFLIDNNFTSLQGWCNDNSKWEDDMFKKMDGITSQCLFIDKDIFWEVGAYIESFPFAGFEDYDLSQRLKKKYIEAYVYTTIMAYHNETDKMNLKSWLERKFRGGITRKSAVKLGYLELTLHPSGFKKNIFKLLYQLRGIILPIIGFIPSRKFYNYCVSGMLGAYHYMGYEKGLSF